ncbi:MAG: hypothetical protein H6Q89_4156 [Myxococcaceae bacterium]|nr:hypothetical protein [Myxococcaceae bacterium]
MNALLVYLVVGLAVGLVAPLVAGRQAMGLVGTCLLGALGAFLGGLLGALGLPDDQLTVVRLAGILHAVLGAAVTLVGVILVREWTGRPRSAAKKKHWTAGLLASDPRSFETISKQHQRR